MIVYHGTDIESACNIINNGIDLSCGDKSVDNGQGFYTTPSYDFALKRAKNTAKTASMFNGRLVQPAVIELEIDLDNAMISYDVNVKSFNGCTDDWKQFIVFNRLGKKFLKKWKIDSKNHNLDAKYDIVIDETADSHIADIVSSMRYAKSIDNLKENISKVDKSNKEYWDKQISLHTLAALNFVKSMKIKNN